MRYFGTSVVVGWIKRFFADVSDNKMCLRVLIEEVNETLKAMMNIVAF